MLQIGMVPDEVRVPDIDETTTAGELPRRYCIRMAREKALALPMSSDEIVLCADTSVYAGRRILDKPDTETEARQSLLCLSGRRHRVVTAVAVRTSDSLQSREVVSVVRMKRLSKEELAAYLATGEWRGKAGGYAIQGKAGALVPWIRGSYSAIVGLPLSETETLLRAHGIMPGHAR